MPTRERWDIYNHDLVHSDLAAPNHTAASVMTYHLILSLCLLLKVDYQQIQGFAESLQHCIKPQISVTSLYGSFSTLNLPYKEVNEFWGLIQCCKDSENLCNIPSLELHSIHQVHKIAAVVCRSEKCLPIFVSPAWLNRKGLWWWKSGYHSLGWRTVWVPELGRTRR